MAARRCGMERLARRHSRLLATLVLAVAAGCARPANPPVVVFDQSLDEFFSIRDPGVLGYSRAADALSRAGYATFSNEQPLPLALASLREASRSLLVLGMRLGDSVGLPALPALRSFLDRGGTVLILAEHDNAYGNADAANELLRDAALKVERRPAPFEANPSVSPGPVTLAISRALNTDSIVLYYAAAVAVNAARGGRVLAVARDGTPVAAYAAVGRGRVIVIGDSEFLWNGGPSFGFRVGGNAAFFLRVVRLGIGAGRTRRGAATELHAARESARTTPTLWVLADSLTPRFGSEPDGYGRFVNELAANGIRVVTGPAEDVDAVLVADPVRALPASLDRVPKLIAIASASSGGAQDLVGLTASLSRSGLVDPEEHPLNRLLATRGINLVAGVLRDSSGGFTAEEGAASGWQGCRWRRVAGITYLHGPVAMLASADSSTRLDRELLWPNSASGIVRRGRVSQAPPRPWPLAVATPRALVLASGSVVSNALWTPTCSSAIARDVSRWLRSKE